WARYVQDPSWSEMKRQLAYKTTWYGSKLVEADGWFASSKTCHVSGHRMDEMPLSVGQWICPVCGVANDRHEHAARNLEALVS
ncbi:MAG: zinc ribbon domain-containing protein, partial [Bacillota bacterium]